MKYLMAQIRQTQSQAAYLRQGGKLCRPASLVCNKPQLLIAFML
jgi:hypothetical protein